MFDKLLKKKRKITQQSFEIPPKNFTYDAKIVSKLQQKDLIALIQDQDKYIAALVKKLQDVREDYGKTVDKCDELAQKNDILNSDFKKVNNQHEELLVKHKELQQAIELFANEKQRIVQLQVKFLCEKNFYPPQKLASIKELQKLLEIYRNQIDLCRKIETQNKRLKVKFNQLQQQIRQISQQARKNHEKSVEETEKITAEDLELMNQQLQEKLKLKKQAIDELTKLAKSEMDEISQLKGQLGRLSENDIGTKATTQQKSQQQTQKYCQCDFDKEILQQKLGYQEDKFNDEIDNLKHQIVVLKDKIQQLQKQLDQTNIANQKASQEILTLSTKNRELQQQYKQCNQKMQTAKQKAQEKQTLLEQLKENMQLYHEIERNHIVIQKQNQTLKAEKINLCSLNKDLQAKLRQANQEQEVFQNKIGKLQTTISQNQETLKSLENELQSKLRKHDYEINQERIKKQQMQRTISVLETKNQQAQKGLESAYAQIQVKNKKIHLFEQKVMEMKNTNKQLKREKQEKDSKINELIGQIEKREEFSRASTQLETQKQPEIIPNTQQSSENNQDDFSFKKKIILLQQQNNLLSHEKQELLNAIEQLSSSLAEKEQQIKKLFVKRQQSIKEIQRLSQIKQGSRSNTLVSQPMTPRQNEIDNQREKKLANKAHRGFDILLKLHTQLYKDYIRIFQKQLKDPSIQSLQKAINLLVNKSTDMKDIFSDYL